jgi:hypothetical protein
MIMSWYLYQYIPLKYSNLLTRLNKLTKGNKMQIREDKTKGLNFMRGRRVPKNESIQM